jgi:hypothetical protein
MQKLLSSIQICASVLEQQNPLERSYRRSKKPLEPGYKKQGKTRQMQADSKLTIENYRMNLVYLFIRCMQQLCTPKLDSIHTNLSSSTWLSTGGLSVFCQMRRRTFIPYVAQVALRFSFFYILMSPNIVVAITTIHKYLTQTVTPTILRP